MVKRGVDVVLSALFLCLSLPILALSALIIRISSPGPVFFRQERMGRGFRPFKIFKLRTMAHADAGLVYTLGPDPRITPFGKLLRRTKVDELPAKIVFPGSTSRSPTLPLIGATMWQ